MFDRAVYFQPASTSVDVKVTERRAPTDESVKLLREMEQAAKDEVIESIQVGDVTFKCVVHAMQDMMNDAVRFRAVFSLNGKQMNVEHTEPRFQYDRTKALTSLRDVIAKEIATEVLGGALRELFERSTFGSVP